MTFENKCHHRDKNTNQQCRRTLVAETDIIFKGRKNQQTLKFRYCPTLENEHVYQLDHRSRSRK